MPAVHHRPAAVPGANREWYVRQRVAGDRHGRNVNIAFMDAHGKSLRTEKIAVLTKWGDGYK